MEKVLKYRIYCETDAKYEYVILESTDAIPTLCPINPAHTIDSDSVTVIEEIGTEDVNITNEVAIKEENPDNKTGGHFKAVGIDFSIPADVSPPQVYTKDITFPTGIALLSAHIDVDASLVGDSVSLQIAPNTIIGAITAIANSGDSVFTVQASVSDNIKVGYNVSIDGEDLGQCTAVDQLGLQITTENTSSGCNAGSLVRMTVVMADNLRMTADNMSKDLGQSKIGGSYIAPGTIIRAVYTNTTADAKEFHFCLEMLY